MTHRAAPPAPPPDHPSERENPWDLMARDGAAWEASLSDEERAQLETAAAEDAIDGADVPDLVAQPDAAT